MVIILPQNNSVRKNVTESPPPPPPSAVVRAGATRHFARIVEVLLALLTWCGVVWYNGSGVAGCSWRGDSTCCGIGWGWM